jgi:salicylate hydroxylase
MAADAPILIAGGGIGGLALAVALARQGRRVTVLEQRKTFETAGAGIQLGPNGVRVLQRLGVAEALRPAVGEPEALEIRDGSSGRLLAALPLGSWISARHGAPYWVAHRRDLHRVLQQAASVEPAVTLRTGFAFAGLSERADDKCVEARSTRGDAVVGSALVGADGLWSSVRRVVAPSASPIFAGSSAMRTVIPASAAGRLAVSNVGLWLSPGANVAHYPVRGGAEIAVVVIAAEAWQGREWDAEADRASLTARLGGLHADLAEPLAAASSWRKWALHGLPPLPRWSLGRVTLMGDAAHPMLPHLAQGGVLALEDAVVLADCLSAYPGDEAQSFGAYEAQRQSRAARVQAMSRHNGRIYHMGPPFAWARNTIFRLAPATRLMAAYDWLYGWRDAGAER